MRQELEEFIGPSPAHRIDIDAIARRGRRVRRRRKAVAGGGAFGVVALTAIGVAILPYGPAAGPAPAASASASPSASPSPALTEADRLLAAVTAAIHKETPQITGLDTFQRLVRQCMETPDGKKGPVHRVVPAGPGVEPIPCPAASGQPPEDLSREYLWRGMLTSGGRQYTITVTMGPVRAPRFPGSPSGAPNDSLTAYSYYLNMVSKGVGVTILVGGAQTKPGDGMTTPFTDENLRAIGLDLAGHLR
ncbi:MAG: hypothetical protein HOV79_05165 [Hamadaea sp.]|nr:hypothetical protein [Hamadaea sp.]